MECFIFDTNGKLVKHAQIDRADEDINLEFLPSGNYVVQVLSEGVQVSKFIVKAN